MVKKLSVKLPTGTATVRVSDDGTVQATASGWGDEGIAQAESNAMAVSAMVEAGIIRQKVQEVADARAKGGKAGANSRKLSADRQYGVWVKKIGEVMSANPEFKFGQRGIRQRLNDALKEQGHYLTPKQLSEAIARSKKA
jgi:hypothetical protein